IGRPERVPHAIERACDARAEQRPDLGTRDEVASRAAGTAPGGEETFFAVERGLHETVEGDRTLAADDLRDGFRSRQNANSPTFPKICGYTPTTKTTMPVSPSATPSAGGTRNGVRSSVAGSWNHICTTTRK